MLNSQISNLIFLSAKEKTGIDELTSILTQLANKGALSNNETIVSNSRHFEALNNAYNAIKEVQKGIDLEISTDLFAIDIREALFHLGQITGEVTTEDLLGKFLLISVSANKFQIFTPSKTLVINILFSFYKISIL